MANDKGSLICCSELLTFEMLPQSQMKVGQDNTVTLPPFLLMDHLIGEPSEEVGGHPIPLFLTPFPIVLCKRTNNYHYNNNS